MTKLFLVALCLICVSAAVASVGVRHAAGGGQCLAIAEVYGGGGNAGAPYNRDYVELANRCPSPVDLSGLSIQYASAAGSFTGAAALAGSIAGRGYFLTAFGSPGSTGAEVAADAQAAFGISATAGKVALVHGADPLGMSCPAAGAAIDLVGYGPSASCFEGGGPAPAPGNTLSVARATVCADTDDNARDFATAPPTPQGSTAGSLVTCPTAVQLRSLVAVGQRGRVLVRWRTGSEVGVLGFNVYRAERRSGRKRLNRALIAVAGSGSARGRTYLWHDRSPAALRFHPSYWLEQVELDGRRFWYGPARPTAST